MPESESPSGIRRQAHLRYRHVIDRTMRPYVDRLIAEIRSAAPAPVYTASAEDALDVPTDFFHNLLHELRTIELERSRGTYERIVSVGASGRWYFDWFERSIGPVVEHVGVEAFEPEPADLPEYATWRPTTADKFDGVDDDSVDLVFAGQTTEHLWAEELEGFLLQAKRVLRRDGVLVLDSPNRLVTEHLDWSHGGHTVELSAVEATELLTLAGFEVESVRGVWRCRFGDTLLELEDGLDDGATVVRRIADATERPDDCFVWWIVARPAGVARADELTERCAALYEQHWSTRVSRGMWPGPGSPDPEVTTDVPLRMRSLPFMLRPGRYDVTIKLGEGDADQITQASLRLILPGDHAVHEFDLDDAVIDGGGVSWTFVQLDLVLALTMAVDMRVDGKCRVEMPVRFTALSGDRGALGRDASAPTAPRNDP